MYPVLSQKSFSSGSRDGASEHEMLVFTAHVVAVD